MSPSTDRIHVVVLTYNRPLQLTRLLGDIARTRGSRAVTVQVYDDASTEDNAAAVALLRREGWGYTRAQSRHGKRGWWRWIHRILGDQQSVDAKYWVVLPDDARLCRGFFDRTLEAWAAIRDERKITLNLMVDAARERQPCWTGVRPQRCGNVDRTQWVDVLLLCERRFFQLLDYRLEPVRETRWRSAPLASSGVGEQMSRRLHAAGATMYRVRDSLVVHAGQQSMMNPAARQSVPLVAVRFVDGPEAAARLTEGAKE